MKWIVSSIIVFSSCVDEFTVGDSFLEKAPGVDVTIDTIFSRAEYSRRFYGMHIINSIMHYPAIGMMLMEK